jgi:hypothetical protein
MKAEEAKLKARQALEQLGAALARGQSETLRAYLAAMGRFHRYSLRNSGQLEEYPDMPALALGSLDIGLDAVMSCLAHELERGPRRLVIEIGYHGPGAVFHEQVNAVRLLSVEVAQEYAVCNGRFGLTNPARTLVVRAIYVRQAGEARSKERELATRSWRGRRRGHGLVSTPSLRSGGSPRTASSI